MVKHDGRYRRARAQVVSDAVDVKAAELLEGLTDGGCETLSAVDYTHRHSSPRSIYVRIRYCPINCLSIIRTANS